MMTKMSWKCEVHSNLRPGSTSCLCTASALAAAALCMPDMVPRIAAPVTQPGVPRLVRAIPHQQTSDRTSARVAQSTRNVDRGMKRGFPVQPMNTDWNVHREGHKETMPALPLTKLITHDLSKDAAKCANATKPFMQT